MEFKVRLTSLVYANVLPASEHIIAENLMYQPFIEETLAGLSVADVVVVPPLGLPSGIVEFAGLYPNVKIGVFPSVTIELMTVSPAEIARHMALTVCSLLKKVFRSAPRQLKGVLSLSSGISVNDSAAPGAMIWKLRGYRFISFSASSLDLILSTTFVDSLTMFPETNSRFLTSTFSEDRLTSEDLINKALDLLTATGVARVEEWSPRSIIESVMPMQYLNRPALR